MKLDLLFLLCLLQISGLLSDTNQSRPKPGECFTINVNPSQCTAYLADKKNPPLLVISLDGFRADYLNRNTVDGKLAAPTVKRLANCGVWASTGMMPVYPTKTFPNHYSIVTGLYPESHGIVDNSFFDPELNVTFSLSSPRMKNPVWWKGNPLWYTARLQNKITATYFWPGSDINDTVREPNLWLRYNGSVPYSERVDQIVRWLKLPVDQRPDLITLYFDEPDHTGHNESPDSPLVTDMIQQVDQQIEYLLDQMRNESILGCINLIILADHGMASTPYGKQVVSLNKLMPNITSIARIYDGIIPSIRPHKDTEEEQDRIAVALQCKDSNMRVYSKWDFPKRHHHNSNIRIPRLLIDMKVGWRAIAKPEQKKGTAGGHGWNNLNPEMQSLFVAQGPSFRKGLEVRSFYNTELYNLMCALIGVTPAPNNGSWGALHHFLATPPNDPVALSMVPIARLTYPENQAVYEERTHRKKCNLLTGSNTQSVDESLNLNATSIKRAIQIHTLWGAPQLKQKDDSDAKILVSSNYISGFNMATGVPTWASYTFDKTQSVVPLQLDTIWRLDVRVPKNSSSICDRNVRSNSIIVPLFPFSTTEGDVLIDTNAIEISAGFEKFWNDFHVKLGRTAVSKGETNVIVGPIVDSNSPSLFVVVSNCNRKALKNCSINQLDVQSFILPTHLKYNTDCMNSDDLFNAHLAGLRDVEQVTGIHFFPQLSYRDKVDLMSRTPLASKILVDPSPSFKEGYEVVANNSPKYLPAKNAIFIAIWFFYRFSFNFN